MIISVTTAMLTSRGPLTMPMCLSGCLSRLCGWAGTRTPSPAWPAGETTEYTCTVQITGFSLAGASVGEDNIPGELVTCCEDHRDVREMATRIHDIVMDSETEPPSKKQKKDSDDAKD